MHAGQTDTVEPLRAIYDKHLDGYDDAYQRGCAQWKTDYETALSMLQGEAQKRGDLAAWTACQTEIERFAGSGRISADAIAEHPPGLAELQRQAVERQSHLRLEHSIAVVRLTGRYVRRLEELKADLTRQGRMEQALAVRDEITRVRGLPRVTAAEFVLAERRAAETEVFVSGPEPALEAESVAAVEPGSGFRLVTTEGVRIYPPGTSPPRASGRVLTRAPLYPTEHASLRQSVSVRAMTGTQRDVSTSSERSYGGVRTARSDETQHDVRLYFRAARTDVDLRDLQAVVQWYAVPVSGSGGTVTPELFEVTYIHLETLTADEVCVDCPPVSAATSTYRSRGGFVPPSSRRHGMRVYGFTVSVFDGNGELLSQAASVSHLRQYASPSLPTSGEALRVRYEAARRAYEQAREALFRGRGDAASREAYEAARNEFSALRDEYLRSGGAEPRP